MIEAKTNKLVEALVKVLIMLMVMVLWVFKAYRRVSFNIPKKAVQQASIRF